MKTEKSFIIYLATNTVNGKRYVGATRKGIEGRSRQHFKDAQRKGKTRDCPRFYDAIRKHGQDAFEWTTLATLPTSEEMYKEEERLIALLKPEYNIASGGLVFISKEKQAQFSASGAQRNSKPVICLNDGSVYPSAAAAALAYGMDRHNLADICNRESIARNGLSFSFIIGPMTEAEREVIFRERKERKAAAELARIKKTTGTISRPVTDLNTGVIYTSATAADRVLNLVVGTAEACCRRGRATRRGECFAFGQLSEPERLRLLALAIENRRAIDTSWKQNLSKRRRLRPAQLVRCDTYGITFSSAEAAEIEYCIAANSIRESCSGRDTMVFGLKFSYVED